MDSLSIFKKKQQKEIQQALQYERYIRERELQNSQLVLKSCERLQMITDRQLQKLKQSQLSAVKHQTHEQRFKSLESDKVHTRPKVELDEEAYSRWISMQKRLLKRVETEKLKKFETKIDRGDKIKQMKEQELKYKQQLRIETDLQKQSIHNEYTHRLLKLQKKEYVKQLQKSYV